MPRESASHLHRSDGESTPCCDGYLKGAVAGPWRICSVCGQREGFAITKTTFNLPTDELDKLRALAAARSVSVTQALRQAIATECFIAEQPEGTKVLLQAPGSKTAREVVFRG